MTRIAPQHRQPGISGQPTPVRRALLGALLVLCLLLSQWLGYSHAIAHMHGQANAAAHAQGEPPAGTQPGSGLFEHQKASGACAALDAATLGASLCSDGLALSALRAPQVPAPALQYQAWRPAFIPLFSSRAPPPDA